MIFHRQVLDCVGIFVIFVFCILLVHPVFGITCADARAAGYITMSTSWADGCGDQGTTVCAPSQQYVDTGYYGSSYCQWYSDCEEVDDGGCFCWDASIGECTSSSTPTSTLAECYETCGYSYSADAIGSAEYNTALALYYNALWRACDLSGPSWAVVEANYPCGGFTPVPTTPNATPTITYFPTVPPLTPHPTPAPHVPYVVHSTPVPYQTMLPVETLQTLPTFAPTLFNETELYQNITEKSSNSTKQFILDGMAVENQIYGVFSPFFLFIVSPLSTIGGSYENSLIQSLAMFTFFASFPMLFMYSGFVLVAYLPEKVMFLGAFCLWVNIIHRGYDFARGKK